MQSDLLRSSWSVLLPTTNLRLLLDECVDQPLADSIKKISGSVKVQCVNELPISNLAFSDDKLVRYATERNQILVTTETRLNEKRFTICTHPGIIVIKAVQHHSEMKSGMLKDLILSGIRARCHHAVTYLKLSKAGNRTVATFKERDESSGIIQTSEVDLTNL